MTVFRGAVLTSLIVSTMTEGCKCPDGSDPVFQQGQPPCQSGPPVGDDCRPQLADDLPAMPGMQGTGQETPACSTLPCAASLLGDVATTLVRSTQPVLNGGYIEAGENVFGPFENGFGEQQKNILIALGCTEENVANAYIQGGIDTAYAEQMVAKGCNVVLPRFVDNTYVSLLDQCGGHTQLYHFHERLSCLYDTAQSDDGKYVPAKVAKTFINDQLIYGKYCYDGIPTDLDACGGHFSTTPDSPDTPVYHYHLQHNPPFTIGCYGPNAKGEKVSNEECRALYAGCTDANYDDTIKYTPWCPCYVNGNNNNGNDGVDANAISSDDGENSSNNGGGNNSKATGMFVGAVVLIMMVVIAIM